MDILHKQFKTVSDTMRSLSERIKKLETFEHGSSTTIIQEIVQEIIQETTLETQLQNKIMRVPSGLEDIEFYDKNDTGLLTALAVAVSGDVVIIPAATAITGGPWTVDSGIALVSASRIDAILTGNLIISGGIAQSLRIVGNVTVNSSGWLDHCTVQASTGNVVSVTKGNVTYCDIYIDDCDYGISAVNAAVGEFIYIGFCRVANIAGSPTQGDGAIINSPEARIIGCRFEGYVNGATIQNCFMVSGCQFEGGANGTGSGLLHSTGTGMIVASGAKKTIAGTGYGVNLSASGLTMIGVSWDTINGQSNITYGLGDRGAYKVTVNHSDDIEGATYTHHWPLSKLNATAAPTVNDDSGDGYAVGSVWVNVTGDDAYICVDASVGAAVWEQFAGVGSGATTFLALTDTPSSYSGTGLDIVQVNSGETALEFTTPVDISSDSANITGVNFVEGSDPTTPIAGHRVVYAKTDGIYEIDDVGAVIGPFSAGSGEQVKVSADDTTAGYLNGKLVAGAGIGLTENNGGSNETLTIYSYYEVLMADGVTPAEPLATETDDDWLYGD